MVYKFFDKKIGLQMSVNKKQAEELHKQVIKRSKRRKVYAGFKTIFGQQVYLKWDHRLQRIKMLHIYYVS